MIGEEDFAHHVTLFSFFSYQRGRVCCFNGPKTSIGQRRCQKGSNGDKVVHGNNDHSSSCDGSFDLVVSCLFVFFLFVRFLVKGSVVGCDGTSGLLDEFWVHDVWMGLLRSGKR
jgi:hypothetical protein